jgi:MFS family permease
MGSSDLSRRRRLLVLAICCTSLFMVGLDSTIVNVALPSIQRDLHSPVSGLQWTVDASPTHGVCAASGRACSSAILAGRRAT